MNDKQENKNETALQNEGGKKTINTAAILFGQTS